jgi:hypothetical protein
MKFVPFLTLLAACCCVVSAHAQDFPAGVTVPAAADVQQRLADKVFNTKLASGQGWRLEYKSNGYFFINVSNGYSDSGKWSAQDGRLCHEPRKTNASCNDLRAGADTLFLKRDNGEIIELVPR